MTDKQRDVLRDIPMGDLCAHISSTVFDLKESERHLRKLASIAGDKYHTTAKIAKTAIRLLHDIIVTDDQNAIRGVLAEIREFLMKSEVIDVITLSNS